MAQFTPAHEHERSDAHVKPLITFLIFMASSVLIAFAIITVLFEFFTQRTATLYGPAVELSTPGAESGAPRLQVVPGLDLQEIRATEAKQLDGYGWVDQSRGIAHVPIDTAIDMLLERGVPSRATAAAATE